MESTTSNWAIEEEGDLITVERTFMEHPPPAEPNRFGGLLGFVHCLVLLYLSFRMAFDLM